MEIMKHTTQHDLRRLRKKEKGYYYLQLADICKKAGFDRKYSCYAVLAYEHLRSLNDSDVQPQTVNSDGKLHSLIL